MRSPDWSLDKAPPTILWGRMKSCGRLLIGLFARECNFRKGPIANRPQDSILPH
jgi:hypothetical protein